MTDYYPLIIRAIEGLDRNTGEARRALYERARNALLAQLKSIKPPLSEAEITRERLALEEAVRKVEAEAARKMRAGNTPPRSPEPEPAPKPDWGWDEPPRRSSGAQTTAPEPRPPRPERPPDRSSYMPARPPLAGEGLKGFRDVVAEAENLGGATAQASRSAREAYAAVPTDTPEFDRIEPRAEPEGMRSSRDYGEQRSPAYTPQDGHPFPQDTSFSERPAGEGEMRSRASGPLPRRPEAAELDEQAVRARKGMMAAIAAVVVILVLAAAAYLQRDRIAALLGGAKTATQQSPRDPSQARPKISDRVGQDGQVEGGARTGPGSGTSAAVVAQRAVLYEEDPNNPEGNRYVGSALWRTETVSPGPGLAPELAIRADVEVPERRLAMTLSIRRNTDQALPASHTIEILFNLPADFAFGGVSNVPGILMKEAEQTRGAPLSGLAVKVTNNFFLVGLSAAEADVTRNLQVLKDRGWFDIPVVYNNGRRAILAVEKGNPGDRVFAEAFRAWGR